MSTKSTTLRHQRPRVVLVAMPSQGHLTPLLDLAYLLHSLNFPVTITHPSSLTSQNLPSLHPHFDFLPFSGFSASSSVGSTGFVEVSKVSELIMDMNVTCKGPIREVLEGLMEEEERKGGRVGCVVYDLNMFMAKGASDELGLMSVGFRTGGGITLLLFVDHCRSGEDRRGAGEVSGGANSGGVGGGRQWSAANGEGRSRLGRRAAAMDEGGGKQWYSGSNLIG